MKTRFLRLGKSSISLALSVLMIISTVLVGSSVTVEPINDDETVAVDVAKNITNTDEIVENTTDTSFDNNKKSTLKKEKVLPNSSKDSATYRFASIFEGDKVRSGSGGNEWELWFHSPYYYFEGGSLTQFTTNNGYVYSITADNSASFIIFAANSNRQAQTVNLPLDGNEGKIFVPESMCPKTIDGWWLTDSEYNTSINLDKHIYFEKPSDWSGAYAYCWNYNGDSSNIELTDDDSDGIYDKTVSSTYTKVIFHADENWVGGASKQTIAYSLVGHDDKLKFSLTNQTITNEYALSSEQGKQLGSWSAVESENPTPTGETKRIYFYNRFNWGNLHCYVNNNVAAWPGLSMTKDTEYSGLYYYDVPKTATTVIFNSGSGFAQTRDIALSNATDDVVLVPDNEETYTGGQWSNLEDYPTVTSTYDGREHYKIYFKLKDKLVSDSKNLYVFEQQDMQEKNLGYFRKQLTRVYDYVDPENESNPQDLYFFIAWKGDSEEQKNNSPSALDNHIDQHEFWMYDDISNDTYVRIANSYDGAGWGDTTTQGITQRQWLTKDNNGQIIVPTGLYQDENIGDNNTRQRVQTRIETNNDYNTTKSDKTTATVYAKSGTIRNSYDKYSRMADVQDLTYNDDGSTITSSTGWSHSTNDGTYRERVAAVEKGRTFTVKVKIKNAFKYKYYVKAWCINGDTYNIIDQDEAIKHKGTGEYTCEYTIGDNEDGPIEITPIYFAFVDNKDSDKYITFYVEDFESVKDDWGGTLACYAYYRTGNDGNTDDTLEPTAENDAQKSALGGYPGQPMVYENGSYYMQIPRTRIATKNSDGNGGYTNITASTETVKGITLNNYVWDFVHSQNIQGLWSDDERQNANCQTYDYDDFVALATVTDEIIFNFKNRTTYNPGDSTTAQSNATKGNDPSASKQTLTKYTNGWDVLTDYYDYPVDLFSNRITNTSYDTEAEIKTANSTVGKDSNLIYVVSNGYEIYNTYIGQYATKWYVYKNDGTFLGALPPSVFYTATPGGTYSLESLMNFGSASNYKNSTISPNDGTHTTYSAVAKYLWEQCKGKPVVITYETALRSVGASGADQNPGLRNDGRWYYSIANSKIWANIKIEYEGDDGEFHEETSLVDGTTTGQGSVTKARAYFTNDSSEGTIDSTKTSMTNVTQTNKNDFRFVADSSSTVTSGDVTTTYVFKGWYLTTGGGVYNPINVGDDLSNPVGKRLMNSNATFVARYEKVTSATLPGNDTTSTRYLTVNHNLLANGPTTNRPTVHNGTGTPLVTVEIIKQTTSGNTTTTTVLKSYKNAPGTNFVKIDPKYLTNDNYKVRVTLTTTTDSETSFMSTYQYDSSYTQATENNNNCTTVDSTNKKVVYEYTVKNLFGYNGTSSTSNTKTLNYYTDLFTNKLKIVFKYYDRKIVNNTPNDISSTETSVPVYGSTYSSEDRTYSIANAITNAFGSTDSSKLFNNVTDQYTFWTYNNDAANVTSGLGDYKNNKTGNKYGKDLTADANGCNIALSYHTDCYGQLPTGSNLTAADKWVSYTTIGSSTVTAYDTASTSANGSDFANIEQVTVWCYNYPKTYNVTLYMPDPSKADTVVFDTTVESPAWTIGDDGIIVAKETIANNGNNGTSVLQSGFYNQRLGGSDTSYTTYDASVGYLEGYSITSGYIDAYTPPKEKITMKVNVTENETTTAKNLTYKFKGWYLNENGVNTLLSTDRYYQNRITKNLYLYAGYEPDDNETSTLPGVTVTNSGQTVENANNVDINGVDYYYDSKGVKRVRFNTELNITNSEDTNTNIKKVAALYLQLPVKTEMGETITWTQKMLDDLGLTDYGQTGTVGYQVKNYVVDYLSKETNPDAISSTKASTSAITLTLGNVNYDSNKMITYDYIAVWSTDVEGYDANKMALLTNKNRLEFVLSMRADYYEGVDSITVNEENEEVTVHIPGSNSAIITYAAVYYDDGSTHKENVNGEEVQVSNAQWIMSDNYVAYMHDLSSI